MAVVPKHTDQHGRYDPNLDLTTEQRHRFTQVANKAQARKDEMRERPSIVAAAKSAAMKPVVTPKKDKPNNARYTIWLIVLGLVSLWAMYMTS
ncbi:hypothetical protein J4N42_20825 [Vibrio sp. SCSIO 43135]|uniref:Uncharacterized protein n=1 Tax=Vibrio paucivorans TaxID=2829489 RepID=A0A9X3HRD4_9VIBR|nr:MULTISPECIES: hypothetical protein [Vibrio]MCW8333851.1 hypothetical protein [Vibrio paucivorans]USD43047.1 hypothetical protein J4N42_20825 [Vibrio sp. SCSIO 43135]